MGRRAPTRLLEYVKMNLSVEIDKATTRYAKKQADRLA
jgi:hypothetical protein